MRGSGLDCVILRPSPFMEWHVHRLLGKGIVESAKTIVMGAGTMPTNFIAAMDLAQYAVAALTDPSLSRRTLELGGPDNVTRRDIVAMYEHHAHRSARVTYVPLGLMRAMSPVRPFNPVVSRLMDVSVWGETTDHCVRRACAAKIPLRIERPVNARPLGHMSYVRFIRRPMPGETLDSENNGLAARRRHIRKTKRHHTGGTR